MLSAYCHNVLWISGLAKSWFGFFSNISLRNLNQTFWPIKGFLNAGQYCLIVCMVSIKLLHFCVFTDLGFLPCIRNGVTLNQPISSFLCLPLKTL